MSILKRPVLRIASALLAGSVLVAATTGITGCATTPLVEIFNATGAPILLSYDDRVTTVPSDETTTVEYADQDPEGVRLCSGGQAYHYEIPFPTAEYFHGIGILFFRYRIRLQVGSDARVWILGKGSEFPLKPEADQPEGFPLKPEVFGPC